MELLRKMFGPSRDEVWGRLAEEVGARYEDRGFWNGGKFFQVQCGEWTVTMDVYTVSTGKTHQTFTRLRAPYVNPDGFRFSVRRRHLFDGIGRLLGLQDVVIGHAAFDEAFVVKSNDEPKVRRLLRMPRIRELLEAQPSVQFQVCDDEGWFGRKFPDGTDELHFIAGGVVKDPALLKGMFALFAETLHGLCQIGSAYEDDPGLEL
jgi:hypothetical protein